MYWEGLLLGQLGFGCSTLCLCLLRLLGKLAEMAKQVWWKMVEIHLFTTPTPLTVRVFVIEFCFFWIHERDGKRHINLKIKCLNNYDIFVRLKEKIF